MSGAVCDHVACEEDAHIDFFVCLVLNLVAEGAREVHTLQARLGYGDDLLLA